ncbi:MAG: hypothetical protein ACJZ40_06020 [Candidatus Poseidoniaceae archaeon]
MNGGNEVFARQFKVLLLLLVLIASTTFGSAEPGGNGDGMRDMQCGGACHGDAGQNASSSLTLSIQYPQQVWVGQPTEITVEVSGVDVSHDEDLVGIFLLSSTNANADTPLTDGWEILSDGRGGTGNYVERSTDGTGTSIVHTWVVRAESVGVRNLYASVHHGDATGSSQGRPFFGVSTAFPVEVEPLPENAPRLAQEFTVEVTRDVGDDIELELTTEFTDAVVIEWRTEDGATMQIDVNESEEDQWKFTLPASLKPSTVEWRAILSGEGPEQTTPWFAMVAQVPAENTDSAPIYLQGIAMALLLFGAVVALQKPRAPVDDKVKIYDNTEHVAASISGGHSAPDEGQERPEVAPIPEGGLPEGWTDEQWAWYGYEYLAGTYGGGQA